MPRPCSTIRAVIAVSLARQWPSTVSVGLLAVGPERPFVEHRRRAVRDQAMREQLVGLRRQPVLAARRPARHRARGRGVPSWRAICSSGSATDGADRDVDAVAHQVEQAVADVEVDAQRRVALAQAGEARAPAGARRSPSSRRCGPGRSAIRCSRRTRLRAPRTCSSGAGSSRERSRPRRSARARASSDAAGARRQRSSMRDSARETWLTGTSRSRAAADSEPSAAMRENSFRSSNASPSIAAMVGGPPLRALQERFEAACRFRGRRPIPTVTSRPSKGARHDDRPSAPFTID